MAMAYDEDLPATGVTAFGILYGKLRDNYIGLKAIIDSLLTLAAYTDFTPDAVWTVNGQCSFMKDPQGFVWLKGTAAKAGANLTYYEFYDRLRTGYKPTQTVYFPCTCSIAGEAWTQIGTDGVIKVYAPAGTKDISVYLDIIRFRAA